MTVILVLMMDIVIVTLKLQNYTSAAVEIGLMEPTAKVGTVIWYIPEVDVRITHFALVS